MWCMNGTHRQCMKNAFQPRRERHDEIVQTRRRPLHSLYTRIRMRGAAQQHTERSHLILLIKLKSILPRGLAQ